MNSCYELSHLQKEILFFQLMYRDSLAYNSIKIFKLNNNLDLSVLQRALNQVVNQCDIMRAFVKKSYSDFHISCKLKDSGFYDILFVKYNNSISALRDLNDFLNLPFDLFAFPLYRVALVEVENSYSMLGISCHHMIADGYSILEIVRMMIARYFLISGNEDDCDVIKSNYYNLFVRYETFQINKLKDSASNFWSTFLIDRSFFQKNPLVINKNVEFNNPNIWQRYLYEIDIRVEASKINSILKKNRLSRFNLMIVFFMMAIMKKFAVSDLIISTAVSFRKKFLKDINQRNAKVMGPIVCMYPCYLSLMKSKTLLEYLVFFKKEFNSFIRSSGIIPISSALNKKNLKILQNNTDFYNIVFVFDDDDAMDVKGITLEPIPVAKRQAPYALSLIIKDCGNKFILICDYNNDIFHKDSIILICDYIKKLVLDFCKE
jgi:hypothetical protein